MSDRLDKLRRLQDALEALLIAVREVDQNLESSEAADLQSVIDEMEEESIRSKMSIEARDRELKEWNRMWHEQVDEVKRLQAENERLRAAGDDIERDFYQQWYLDTYENLEAFESIPSIKAWIAAKGVKS